MDTIPTAEQVRSHATKVEQEYKEHAIRILQRHFAHSPTTKKDGTCEVNVFEQHRRVAEWVVTILKEKGFTIIGAITNRRTDINGYSDIVKYHT